jgi:hypothetical protein
VLSPAHRKSHTRERFAILYGVILKMSIHGQCHLEAQVGCLEIRCLQRYVIPYPSYLMSLITSQFNHVNGLQLIARAHQLVNEGYKYHFKDKDVVTVWSAPNYCYRCGNVASIMNLGEDLKPEFQIFSAVPDHKRAVPAGRGGRGEYFL